MPGPFRIPGRGPRPTLGFLSPVAKGNASSPIAGTAAITFGQSGAVSGAGALAGTSPIVFGQSGAVSGAGAMAGTSPVVFGQSGNVAGNGALAGTAPIAFGQSGAVSGAGALAGTASIAFGQSGAVAGDGALSGTAGIVFGQSGTIVDSGGLPVATQRDGDGQIRPLPGGPARKSRAIIDALERLEAIERDIRAARSRMVRKRKIADARRKVAEIREGQPPVIIGLLDTLDADMTSMLAPGAEYPAIKAKSLEQAELTKTAIRRKHNNSLAIALLMAA